MVNSHWWFGTWIVFSIKKYIWNNHSHWRAYFSRWLKPPTSDPIAAPGQSPSYQPFADQQIWVSNQLGSSCIPVFVGTGKKTVADQKTTKPWIYNNLKPLELGDTGNHWKTVLFHWQNPHESTTSWDHTKELQSWSLVQVSCTPLAHYERSWLIQA